ncbi:MAG: DUF6147 family protein [Lachnospiraceae bacterium]
MGKKVKRAVSIGILSCLLFSLPVYADTKEDTLVSPYQIEAADYDTARGDYISSSIARVTNAGGGAIGISAATTAHEPVDKIRIHLYLDRLDSDGRWTQVDDFDFTFTPEDDPYGELTIASVDFEVTDQPSGYYYRVRGTHGVWKNGVSETQSTRTNGVMITDTP